MTAERTGAPLLPKPWLQTDFTEQHAQFSPDGRWVSYQANESGRDEVYVAPFSGPGGKRQVSTEGGGSPRWRRDGQEIFFLKGQTLTAVDVRTNGSALEFGPPHPLLGPLPLGDFSYDVSKDGYRFLAEVTEQLAYPELTVVQNWPAGLKTKSNGGLT